MPPKNKGTPDVKQKTIQSFFGNPKEKDTSKSVVSTPKTATPKAVPKASSSGSAFKPLMAKTPANKNLKKAEDGQSSAGSNGSGSAAPPDTPATSEPIYVDDVEMVDAQRPQPRTTTGKRKMMIIEDSDSDGNNPRNHPSSPTVPPKSRAKKARLSAPPSGDDDEDDESTQTASFSNSLTKFKKKPTPKSVRSNASDDDDFAVPSDSDEPRPSSRFSNRGSSSSRAGSASEREESEAADTDEDADEASAPKKKAPAKAKSKPKKAIAKNATASGSGGGPENFLTQAEIRAQEKKDDKKAAEDPYAFLLKATDKDGVKPGDPGYDPRTLFIPQSAWKDFTPFEKQFWEIKQNHYDTILFFQKGKFLELYEEDARIGHREFDLKMTTRVKMSMVGVPETSFNFWASKFLAKGYKVGRVDQAETALGAEMRQAAAKKASGKAADKNKDKIVRRELNKVYTNGTLVDPELLLDEQAGHCIAIREKEDDEGNHFGLCVLDCATSQFDLSAFSDDICRTKLETVMRQLRPKEIVFTKGTLSVSTTRLLKTILSANCIWTSLRESEGFGFDETIAELRTLYPSADEFAMDDDDISENENVPKSIRDMVKSQPAIEALGAMIWYLRQLNIDKDILSMKNFNIYDPMKKGRGLVLDGQTLAHIEVLQNNEGTDEGSLLKLLGRCVTPFGKRLFRIWLCMPLRDVADINARLDAVQDLMDHTTFQEEFDGVAKGLPDLERIVSRIHAKNCKIRDFVKVLAAFEQLGDGMVKLADLSEAFRSKTVHGLLRSAPDLTKHIRNVESMYEEPDHGAEKDVDELVPREGKDKEYDEIMEEINGLEKSLNRQLKALSKSVGYDLSYWHSGTGTKEIYLVQTKPGAKAPKDWTKTGSTKAATRYVVGSLQADIRALKEAREKRTGAIKSFKLRLFAEFDVDRAVWLQAIKVFAELDCLFSLSKASAAMGEPSCRPVFVEGDSASVDFEELRHPALSAGTKAFIPNNVKLGGDVGRIALLTGPNMGGKSTVMRMTATGVIMAQLGMMVPAKSARICPVDAILTRMGAYDNMFASASTFKVELDECCKILRDATPKSFVILDELGRGTSTYDGMAIAAAVLHQLATHTLPLSFFATHYGSLTDDFAYHPNIRNMHMSTLVDNDKRALVFLYKLVDGVAESSFGTHVANLAGVPMDVIKRAEIVSADFARNFKETQVGKQKKASTSRVPLVAQADFAYLFKLATGAIVLPEDPVRKREVLVRMKKAVLKSLPAVLGA